MKPLLPDCVLCMEHPASKGGLLCDNCRAMADSLSTKRDFKKPKKKKKTK